MNMLKYAIIGGDYRNIKLAYFLKQEYNYVNTLALDGPINKSNFFNELKKVDVVIGSIPASSAKNVNQMNTPLCVGDASTQAQHTSDTLPQNCEIYFEEILPHMKKGSIFIAGKIDYKIKELFLEKGIEPIDILDREDFAIFNAAASAEGAILTAMQNTDFTIHGSRVLIAGFGRIGKVLASMLSALNAKVYVEARKKEDIAWIENYGYFPIDISELKNYISEFDIIFNTIPYCIFNKDLLEKTNTNCIIIDLASLPGGVDFKAAEGFNIKTIHALSLPGKTAPLTAARYIKKTIDNIIFERSIK